VIKEPRERGGHSPRWAAEPEKIIIISSIHDIYLSIYDILLFIIAFIVYMILEGVVGTAWSWLRIGTGGGHL
jgi:hypothetical protein